MHPSTLRTKEMSIAFCAPNTDRLGESICKQCRHKDFRLVVIYAFIMIENDLHIVQLEKLNELDHVCIDSLRPRRVHFPARYCNIWKRTWFRKDRSTLPCAQLLSCLHLPLEQLPRKSTNSPTKLCPSHLSSLFQQFYADFRFLPRRTPENFCFETLWGCQVGNS